MGTRDGAGLSDHVRALRTLSGRFQPLGGGPGIFKRLEKPGLKTHRVATAVGRPDGGVSTIQDKGVSDHTPVQ